MRVKSQNVVLLVVSGFFNKAPRWWKRTSPPVDSVYVGRSMYSSEFAWRGSTVRIILERLCTVESDTSCQNLLPIRKGCSLPQRSLDFRSTRTKALTKPWKFCVTRCVAFSTTILHDLMTGPGLSTKEPKWPWIRDDGGFRNGRIRSHHQFIRPLFFLITQEEIQRRCIIPLSLGACPNLVPTNDFQTDVSDLFTSGIQLSFDQQIWNGPIKTLGSFVGTKGPPQLCLRCQPLLNFFHSISLFSQFSIAEQSKAS